MASLQKDESIETKTLIVTGQSKSSGSLTSMLSAVINKLETTRILADMPSVKTVENSMELTETEEDLKEPLLKEVNILLLGETGVGKSTWVNAIANYLTYDTLDDAIKAWEVEPMVLIPSQFIMTDDKYDEVTIHIGKTDTNEVHAAGQSTTQHPKTYTFRTPNLLIRIIDTPGIADTRGLKQDKENFQLIINHISNVDVIHGICLLLKPNNSRLNIFFEFCVKEIMTQLHKDCRHNMAFCFTNVRSTFYRPGDTLTALRDLLKHENTGKMLIPLEKKTIYCLDNEAFRFLATKKHGLSFDPYEMANFEESWKSSVIETKRMIEYFLTLKPYKSKNTITLNTTQETLDKLAEPLAEVSQVVQTNIAVLEDKSNELKRLDSEAANLKKEILSKRIPKNPVFQLVDKPAELFTGRDDILQQIHSRMKICATKTKWTERIVVLHGVEGIGKSELARQYAHLYRNDPIIQNTFWINAETFTSLYNSFFNVLNALEPNFTSRSAERIIKQVYQHFSKNLKNGLFIFDNAMQMRGKQMEILSFLPKQVMSNIPLILIASQFDQWQLPRENILKLDKLTEQEGKALFLNNWVGSKRAHPVPDLPFLKYLDCHPLSILLASFSISMGNMQEFIQELELPNFSTSQAEVALYKVLQISLKKITSLDETSLDSLKLLYTLAYLPPDQIPRRDIRIWFCDKDLKLLEDYFLVKGTTTVYHHKTIQIHRLVQDFTRKFLDSKNDHSHLFDICESLTAHVDFDSFENEAICLHRHLKERNWPSESILYSMIFAAKLLINITNVPSAQGSAWEILQDVYIYLDSNTNLNFLSVSRKLIVELLHLCLYYFSTNYEYCEDTFFKKISQMGQNLETTVGEALETTFGLGQKPSLEVRIGAKTNLVYNLHHRICEILLEYPAWEHTKLAQNKIANLLLTDGPWAEWNTVVKVKHLYEMIWNYCKNSQSMSQMMEQYWRRHKSFYKTLSNNNEFKAYWENGGPFPLKEIVEQLFYIESNEDYDWDQDLKALFVESFIKHDGPAILVNQMDCWIRKKYTSAETKLLFQFVAGLAFEWNSVHSISLYTDFFKVLRNLTETIFEDDHNSVEIKVWSILTWFALFSKAKSIIDNKNISWSIESCTVSLEHINEMITTGSKTGLNTIKMSFPKLRQTYINILKSFLDLNSCSPQSTGNTVAAHLLSVLEKRIDNSDGSCDEPESMEHKLSHIGTENLQVQVPLQLLVKGKCISKKPDSIEPPIQKKNQHQQVRVKINNRTFKVGGGFTVTGHVETFVSDVTADDSKRKLSYDHTGKGKGSVLIINNTFVVRKSKGSLAADVNSELEVSEREGSENDVKATTKLFEDMGCLVFREEDVNSADLPYLLDNFKTTCKDNNSSFCITIVMTHGGDTELSLVMSDLKEINIYEDVVYPFSQKDFDFHGRPKIFLIQACVSCKSARRSNFFDFDDKVVEDARRGSRRQLPPSSAPHAELADVFIGAAFLPCRHSYRDPICGAWYIQSIHEIFASCWKNTDLETMHRAVEHSVIRKVNALYKKRGLFEEKLLVSPPYVHKIGFSKQFNFPLDLLKV